MCFDHSGLPPYLISPRDTFSPTGYDPWGIGPIPGVSGLWNGGTKIPSMYRHSFEYLVHNQYFTLEFLGFHYMQLSKFEVKCAKFLFYKNNFYNLDVFMKGFIV